MARTVLVLNNPLFMVADTQAGLDAGEAFECQLTSALINPQPTTQTIPATGCAPATNSPGKTGYQLDLAWLQDWSAPAGGMSNYAFTNDGTSKWYRLVADKNATPQVIAEGQAYVVAGGFGGTFGDGSAAATTATWPCLDKPEITTPAVAVMEAEGLLPQDQTTVVG